MSYVHHTILLVDNDLDMAHFTILALQRVGVITPVQMVKDAQEAMAYLTGEGGYADRDNYPLPLILLLDLELPGASGFDLLSWVRRQPGIRRLPVIVLTRPGSAADVNHAYDLGCNAYLSKPASFNTLLVMMQSLVQYWLSLNTAPDLLAPPEGQPATRLQQEMVESQPETGA